MKGAGAAVVIRSRALIDVEVDRELGEESWSTHFYGRLLDREGQNGKGKFQTKLAHLA